MLAKQEKNTNRIGTVLTNCIPCEHYIKLPHTVAIFVFCRCLSLASLCLERRWLHQAFQVQAWAGRMEILECPVTRTTRLDVLLAGSDGKASRYGRCQCSCRSCQKVLQCLTIHLRGSTPDFLSGYTPLAFDQPRPTCKAAGDSFR